VRGQRHDPAAPYTGKDPVPIVQEAIEHIKFIIVSCPYTIIANHP